MEAVQEIDIFNKQFNKALSAYSRTPKKSVILFFLIPSILFALFFFCPSLSVDVVSPPHYGMRLRFHYKNNSATTLSSLPCHDSRRIVRYESALGSWCAWEINENLHNTDI